MSQYVLIAGAACELVGFILTGVATAITAVKGNQSKDATEKGALRAAAGFLGISILFAIISLVLGFKLAALKSCAKKSRVTFLIFFSLFAVCYIIGLVIIGIYRNRRVKAGDSAGARDLQAAFVMPLVAIPLYIIGFILIYSVIGRRMKRISKMCKKGKQASGKNF